MSRSPNVVYLDSIDPAFCIEGGGTHSRGCIYSDLTTASEIANSGMCNPTTNFKAAVNSVNEIWQSLNSTTKLDSKNVRLFLGCAGLVPDDVRTNFVNEFKDFKEVVPISDGYAALVGANEGKPCGMVVAGTGCAGHRMSVDGTSYQRDGWGWIAADRGSGFWIGHKAINHALMVRDGLFPKDDMYELVINDLGSTNAEIAGWFNEFDPKDIAKFAKHVFTCAENKNIYADEILTKAAYYLRLLFTALECNDDDPLFLAGSIAEALHGRIAAGMKNKPQIVNCKALDGCALVAFGKAPIEWEA